MALSGSCPGTVLAQVGAGLQTGINTLSGAIIGGLAWTGPISKLVKYQKDKAGVQSQVCTLDENAGLSKTATLLAFETACLSVVAGTVIYTQGTTNWTVFPAASGIFIGLAQLFSLLVRRSMLGVSGSYEEVGNYFWWLVKGADSKTRPKGYQNMLFASGVAAGAFALLKYFPELATPTFLEAPQHLAVAGGVLMVVGARLAGGCTSGHGISGLSLLSTSSLITIASMFVAGASIAPLVY